MRVIAALSGGVDSAVAAARAVDAGHQVTGVHLALASERGQPGGRARGCCTLDDAHDARRVADVLGIPFYIWDLAGRFRADVIDDFVAEYAAGRTPNPCLRCNEKIKFAAVLDRARALGFDAVATGHYARLIDGPRGRELHRAADPDKDQSYVLGVLTREQLSGSMFPLGDSVKSRVRAQAAERGLLVADKPDSHDICFITSGTTGSWLRDTLGSEPGEIIDAVSGDVLGRHDGAYAYTVGQRRGLGLREPAADGQPRYVVDVEPATRTVLVGPPALLDVDLLIGSQARWATGPPAAWPLRCGVQIRAHGTETPATAAPGADGELELRLDEPVRGAAPGQAAVLYDGSRVVGSATISRTGRPDDRKS